MKDQINQIYDHNNAPNASEIEIIESVIQKVDGGELRVCEKKDSTWITHEWIKKAILLYFKIKKNEVIHSGAFDYFDKIPIKKWTGNEGVRVVPQAVARYGSFIDKGAILMPSYVNIGAFVGSGTMVDTWATVGSCAQIGSNVHLSGGVGIGGVLEPAQAQPVIIEDDVFVGSRAIIVEGVRVAKGAVIGAGVVLTASTKIVDVRGGTPQITTGLIPERAVVIPGT